MQKPKVGSVIITTKDFDTLVVKGTLGVVLAIEEDATSWGIKNLTLDFGSRGDKILKYTITDMSTILPYTMPKKVKDTVAAKL